MEKVEEPIEEEEEEEAAADGEEDEDGTVEEDEEESGSKTRTVDKTIWNYILVNDNKPIWTRK